MGADYDCPNYDIRTPQTTNPHSAAIEDGKPDGPVYRTGIHTTGNFDF